MQARKRNGRADDEFLMMGVKYEWTWCMYIGSLFSLHGTCGFCSEHSLWIMLAP